MTRRTRTPPRKRATTVISERAVGWACCLVLLVAGATAAAGNRDQASEKAKAPYALIFGTVYGPDNRPVYGVHVKIRRAQEKKARWEQYSNHEGEFAQRVPAGSADYVVWADLKGKKGQAKPAETKVHVDNDERVDIGLHLTE